MPKKTHMHTELSQKVCEVKGCRRRLKERLVQTKLPQNITKCYPHYLIERRRVQNVNR